MPSAARRRRARKRDETRPTPIQRGYGQAHKALRQAWIPRVAAGGVRCARCGELIGAGERFDLGHRDEDRSKYAGPEHERCNRATQSRRRRRSPGVW